MQKRVQAISRMIVAVIVIILIVIAASTALLLRSGTSSSTVSTSSSSTTASQTSALSTSSQSSSQVSPTSSVSGSSTSSSSVTSSATSSVSGSLQPQNSSQLTDISITGAEGVVDSLDPATGFTLGDGPPYVAVYQGLVEFNGTSLGIGIPILASSYTIENNYKTYNFNVRPGVYFSNGDGPVSAYDAWFSLERINLMGQGPGVANYVLLLYYANYTHSGYALPWGIGNAIHAATGLPTDTNQTLAAYALDNILNHFDPSNSTIQKVMSYPNQALVAYNQSTFQVNILTPYYWFLSDYGAGSWWGAVLDPAFIDAHGGVQVNGVNSYLVNNPQPGTGPYVVKSYTIATQIVLNKNPNYWGNNLTNPNVVDMPAHIPVIVISYGESQTNRVQQFTKNLAQISFVDIPYINQITSAFPSGYPTSSYLINTGPTYGEYFISMNTQKFPTNITSFRQALVHAVNLTAMEQELCPGACSSFVGPIAPYYANLYNPGNLPPYNFSIPLALHLINQSGWQGNFNVVLPNGTLLGNPKAPQLPTLTLVGVAPVTSFAQTQFSILQADFAQIGVYTTFQAQEPGTLLPQETTVQGTPALELNAWFPGWGDAVFGEMIAITGPAGAPGGNYAWFNDSTIYNLYNTLPFITNQTQVLQDVKMVYQTVYNDAPYLWLPETDTIFFVQPYIHGFVFNPLLSYYYQDMYY